MHSCIHITDSITDGFSYFYSEVKCLRTLIEKIHAQHNFPVFYFIDEIFRGTNNRERLIGSQSFLKHITGRNAFGLIATHDLELANLAAENTNIMNYHFRDEVKDGKLVFDYKLHPGPSTTTNALKIMQLEGLPVE
jgi:DNA mismatch repair ATPase MutS